jgi:uncharacterized protein YebE (UPF0316 family)
MRDIVLLLILQLIYVPMLALRTISMVKKLALLTAFFGFLESLIYVFGLAIVLSGDQSLLGMFVYAIGFSLGLILGIHIENKIAIGYTTINVNISHRNDEMTAHLREQGYGVTIFQGEGRESVRYRYEVLTKRSREIELMDIVDRYEPKAFIVSYEPTRFKGGYLTDLMKKQNRLLSKIANSQKLKSTIETEPHTSWIKKTTDEIVFEVNELSGKEIFSNETQK